MNNKVKKFDELFESKNIWEKYGKKLPEIFLRTKYDLPTTEDLIDINSFNLKSDDIIEGFKYTIIGRGITSVENKLKILKSLESLSKLYPDNIEYIKALEKFKNEL